MSSLKHCFHADKSSPASHYALKTRERFKIICQKNSFDITRLCSNERGGGSSSLLGPEIVFKGDSFAQRPRFLNTVSRENLGSK